jgi:hypothetical protein
LTKKKKNWSKRERYKYIICAIIKGRCYKEVNRNYFVELVS